MRKKLCGFFAGLPVPAMLGAAVTFAVHLLKENHHNSTIPLFSVLCVFVIEAYFVPAAFYLLGTALCLLTAPIFCKIFRKT